MRSKLPVIAAILILATASQAEGVNYWSVGAGAHRLHEPQAVVFSLAQSVSSGVWSIVTDMRGDATPANLNRNESQIELARADAKPDPRLGLVDQKKGAAHGPTAPSAAQNRIMTPLLGNTLVYGSDFPMEIRHEVYNADHTWVTWFPRAAPKWGNSYGTPHFRGTWEFDGDGTLCAIYHRSNLHPNQRRCSRMTVHHVGDTWTNSDHVKVSLISGIQ